MRWSAKPTAGYERHGQSAVSDDADGKTIAIVYDGKAHANLIAAAPALRRELQKLVTMHREAVFICGRDDQKAVDDQVNACEDALGLCIS